MVIRTKRIMFVGKDYSSLYWNGGKTFKISFAFIFLFFPIYWYCSSVPSFTRTSVQRAWWIVCRISELADHSKAASVYIVYELETCQYIHIYNHIIYSHIAKERDELKSSLFCCATVSKWKRLQMTENK